MKLAIRAGLMSRSEVISGNGYDAEDVDREIAADNARADALGLVFDSDARHEQAANAVSAQPSDVQNDALNDSQNDAQTEEQQTPESGASSPNNQDPQP